MQIQVSVAITSYTVSVYDWQHFKKLCDFSRSVSFRVFLDTWQLILMSCVSRTVFAP